MNFRELSALIPLVIVVAWLGIYPKYVLQPIDNSAKLLVKLMETKAITKEAKELISSVNKVGEVK